MGRSNKIFFGAEKIAMARGFHCEFRNASCDDPRCKIGHCVPEAELNARFNRDFPPESSQTMEPDLAREAKVIAKSILKENGIKPTKEIIEKVIAMPRIRGLALDQLRDTTNCCIKFSSEPLVRSWQRKSVQHKPSPSIAVC